MPQMVVTVNADERESVWHIDTSNGQSAAQIWPVRNLGIEWADGTLETLPKRIRALTNPGGGAQVDITSLDYYIAAYRGGIAANVPPSIVPVTALATLDTLFTGKDWGLFRVFGKWGSRDPLVGVGAGSGLPDGAQGDILRYENGAWEVYPPTAVGSLLFLQIGPHGLQPVWVPAATVIGPYLPTNDSTVGSGIALDLGPGGTPPTNWFSSLFVPSGWGPTIAASPLIVQFTGTPGAWISYSTANVSATDVWLLRGNFSVPPGAATCTLNIKADNYLDAVYINGTNMGFSGAWWNTTLTNPPIAVNVPIANLTLGGTNLIALQLRNGDNIPPGPNPTGVIYSLSFT